MPGSPQHGQLWFGLWLAASYREGIEEEDAMTYPPVLRATTAPGLVDLLAAGETLRDCAMTYINLIPQHWHSPAAQAYRTRIKERADYVQAAAGQVDVAIVAAQHHGDQLDYVRQALAGGLRVPV